MATGGDNFDPYRDWLGIPPSEQPPDYYLLLGLPPFEGDSSRIIAAADMRMGYLRTLQAGPRGKHTAKLLNELATARLCLLSPTAKAAYDAWLHAQLTKRQLAVQAGRPGVMQPAAFPSAGPGGPPRAVPLARLPAGLAMPAAIAPPAVRPVQPVHSESPAVVLGPPLEQEEEDGPWVSPLRPWLYAAALVGLVLSGIFGWQISQNIQRRKAATAKAAKVRAERAAAAEEAQAAEAQAAHDARLVRQEGSGELNFSPSLALLEGAAELRLGPENLLSNLAGGEDSAQWVFHLVRPGFFNAEVTYSTPADFSGAALELQTGTQVKHIELRASSGTDTFHTDQVTLAVTTSGEHELTARIVPPGAGAAVLLKMIRFVPVRVGGVE